MEEHKECIYYAPDCGRFLSSHDMERIMVFNLNKTSLFLVEYISVLHSLTLKSCIFVTTTYSAQYKANRPPKPLDLIPQFELVKRAATEAFGIPCRPSRL